MIIIRKIGREWSSWDANNRRCKFSDQKRIYCSEIANELWQSTIGHYVHCSSRDRGIEDYWHMHNLSLSLRMKEWSNRTLAIHVVQRPCRSTRRAASAIWPARRGACQVGVVVVANYLNLALAGAGESAEAEARWRRKTLSRGVPLRGRPLAEDLIQPQ